MPYIPQTHRDCNIPSTLAPGNLTYELFLLCMSALPRDPNYKDYNTLLGCLEATKLELYRRHIGPYEQTKLEEHGDVCPLEP